MPDERLEMKIVSKRIMDDTVFFIELSVERLALKELPKIVEEKAV